MTQYIVLFPISLDSGPLIMPAETGEPPVIVDDATLFASPSEFFTNDERAKILIDRGAIALAPAKAIAAAEKAKAHEPPSEPSTTKE